MRRALGCILLLGLLAACDSGGAGNSPATALASAPTTESVLAAFKAANIPIGATVVYSESTDPNKLLGRPNQYVAKVAWYDTRLPAPPDLTDLHDTVGGVLEVWPDAASATARA